MKLKRDDRKRVVNINVFSCVAVLGLKLALEF